MQFTKLEHRFCTNVPESLQPGVLYVSMEYATAAHSCCCGCGEEVVTPFTPTDWKMTFDGQTISLWPSVGNWTLPCRSHYVIRDGSVFEARPWTEKEIALDRQRDHAMKELYYKVAMEGATVPEKPKHTQQTAVRLDWRQRFRIWAIQRILKQ